MRMPFVHHYLLFCFPYPLFYINSPFPTHCLLPLLLQRMLKDFPELKEAVQQSLSLEVFSHGQISGGGARPACALVQVNNGLCLLSSQADLGWAPGPVLASLPPAWVEMVTEMMQSKPGRVEAGRVKLVTLAEALGSHCQGQTFRGMLAPAPTSSPSHLVDGQKRKWREILPSWVSLPTFSHSLLSFPQ